MNNQSWRRVCSLASLVAAFAALNACAPNPGIGGIDTYAATTPESFTEARAMYLADSGEYFDAFGMHWHGAPVDDQRPLRQLLYPYQVNRGLDRDTDVLINELLKPAAAGAPAVQPVPGTGEGGTPPQERELTRAMQLKARGYSDKQIIGEYYVLHNQPLSVIVSKVTTPPQIDAEGNAVPGASAPTRDIAVILDILSKEKEQVEPLVVWYQRDVPAGDALNFENLIVYYNQAWDSKVPPYFRLRLLDVETEDNAATRRLLEQVSGAVGSFGAVVPHPALPFVQIGIEAGKQILGNRNNTVLMDYTVQFYSAEDRTAAGGADLGYLRKGHWIVVGKDARNDAEYWTRSFFMDQRTQRVYGGNENGEMRALGMPTILMTITTAESVVPTIVLDRSRELTKLLTADPTSQDFDALSNKLKTVTSGMRTYIASRRVQKEQNGEAMAGLVKVLQRHKTASERNASPDIAEDILSSSDIQIALLTLERTTGQSFSTVEEVLAWWPTNDQTHARFEFDPALGRSIWRSK